jgi:phage antirepressor YoqD-like protein
MEVKVIHSQQSMTSLEIAELTGKRHDNVTADIGKMLTEIGLYAPDFSGTYTNQQGNTYKCFHLPKRETLILVSGYSVAMRAKIIDRWQELEAQQQAQAVHAIPQTMAQALRLAADQAEQIEKQQFLLEQQKPAVEFVDRFVEAKSAKGFREVAKILGLKEREFIAELARDGVIFKQGSNWLPMANHQHAGRFTVKTGEANGHAFTQTRFTPEGIAWVAKRYAEAA